MILRLPLQGVFSFIACYACVRQQTRTSSRGLSTCGIRTNASQKAAVTRARRPKDKRSLHVSAPLSASAKNPYQVLGVAKDASAAEIKKIYFSLARKYHPDTNPDQGAREKFVEIQEAYDILKDDKKRAAYDQYGAASQQPGFDPDAFARSSFGAGSSGFSGFSDFNAAFGGASAGDLFDQLFGGAFSGRMRTGTGFGQNVRGSDIEASVSVGFMDACKGTIRTVSVNPIAACSTCSGTGLRHGSKRSTCGSCGGSGTRTFVIDSGFQMASTCSSCHGTGTTIPRGSQCTECGGQGNVRLRKSVKVEIPPGVEDGMAIRVAGAGDAPISGKGSNGDLLVRVNVAPSKIFRRQGANLYHEARIPLHTALLGGRVRVPTLDGSVDVRVPSGTQHGEEMVLRDHGVQSIMRGDKGDLYVSFSIQLPRTLTKQQREILQRYADDVEGRSSSATDNVTTPDSSSSASKEDAVNADTNDDNGTNSFHSPPPSRGGGWISRTWKSIRGLIGV